RLRGERWLKMPVQRKDGTLQQKEGQGTRQRGVISPLLVNPYLHFSLAMWLSKHFPEVNFVRYADDIVIHCNSKEEAEKVLEAVKQRLIHVKLRVNSSKTRIAYCKDYKRKENHETVKFEFLGFSYQPGARIGKFDGLIYTAFTAEISQSNQKRIRDIIRENKLWNNTTLDITDIAKSLNMKLRGWINYYSKYSKNKLRRSLIKVDSRLIKWMKNKYKINTRKSIIKLKQIKQLNPNLFYHWQNGYC